MGVAPKNADSPMVESAMEAQAEQAALDKVQEVIHIAPGSKYVILMDKDVGPETLEYVQFLFEDWWQSDIPFLIVGGGAMKFIKVDE